MSTIFFLWRLFLGKRHDVFRPSASHFGPSGDGDVHEGTHSLVQNRVSWAKIVSPPWADGIALPQSDCMRYQQLSYVQPERPEKIGPCRLVCLGYFAGKK